MKKILAFLLGLILTLAVLFVSFDSPFSGTDITNPPTGMPTTVPTPSPSSPTDTIPQVIELPMSAIVLTEQTEWSRDENGVVYFSYIYPNIRLFLNDASVSETVTLDLLNRIDGTRTKANSVRQDAASLSGVTCFYQVRYAPQRIDSAILSLSATMTSFSGGAHPGSACAGITYDLLTGTCLTLDDVLTDACTPDVLCRLVVDALESIRTDGLLYEDYTVSVEDRFSGNYLYDDSWYLSNAGLCFSFEPYEIGPYSSGTITAVIPYHRLPGYLEDAYFPPEQISAPGKLIIRDSEADNMETDLTLAEVILDPESEALLIHTDGVLYQVTIQTLYPQPSTIFAADQLTPGSAILLRGDPKNLQISYIVDGETVTQPISAT